MPGEAMPTAELEAVADRIASCCHAIAEILDRELPAAQLTVIEQIVAVVLLDTGTDPQTFFRGVETSIAHYSNHPRFKGRQS